MDDGRDRGPVEGLSVYAQILAVVSLAPMNPLEPGDVSVTVTDEAELGSLIDRTLSSSLEGG